MTTDRNRALGAVCALLVYSTAVPHPESVHAQTPAAIVGTATQLTADDDQSTDPSLSGSIVVWTNRHLTHDDVYFCDVADCSGTQRPVVTATSFTRRFNDVSGPLVTFTEFNTPNRFVVVYDVVAGATKAVAPGSNDANPRIDGQIVVFERGLSPNASVYAFDVNSGVETPVFLSSDGMQAINPVVSGTRVVYQRLQDHGTGSDIILHDLATGLDIDVEAESDVSGRPDVDGDIVVYEVQSSVGDWDVAIHRVSTGTTTRIQRPGDQRGPHVSGDVVVFDDGTLVDSNIGLYHIPTGTMQFIGDSGVADRLNDIDGHRVVYQSFQGNNDIWMYEFEVQTPDIDVAPTTHDFGDVNIGASAPAILTISNVGALPLTVSNIAFHAGSSAAFTATFPGVVPTVLDSGATLDVPVTFKPTAPGVVGAVVDIVSDDLDEALVQVALSGAGMVVTPTPLQQISEILAFFDASVGNRTLFGAGPGSSAKGRLDALRHMIEASGDLIGDGRYTAACDQLLDALHRVDGDPQPPDFAAGPAAAELLQRIRSLRAGLGCP